MIVGIPRETLPGERRVAICPDAVSTLTGAGLEVMVEEGAGDGAGIGDHEYAAQGAHVVSDRAELYGSCEVVAQVNTYAANPTAGRADLEVLRRGQVVVGMADPLGAAPRVAELAACGVTGFGMELIPRITRAQSMDVLSSMAMVAGYKAVILAAERLPRCLPMFMTAAGTVKPARVFVIGAGVAGLQAIATAKRLGAVVRAFDVRPQVREQVESVGGSFVSLALDSDGAEGAGGYANDKGEEFYARQRAMMAEVVAGSDVVITTAAIPGRPAPVLVTSEMVSAMEPGSVVVDLAAPRGGNCAATVPGEEVVVDGVTVIGPLNIAASVPYHASRMYSRNLMAFLRHLVRERNLALDLADEITAGTLMCRDGEIVNARVRESLGMEPLPC